MRNRKIFLVVFFLSAILLFFYQIFLFGKLPFPGDLLISEYSPWRFSSYLGYNPGSFPNKAQYFDTVLQIYPWRSISMDLIKKFQPPLWNPYNFSGSPLLANIQSAPFYPANIFYFVFPEEYSWSLLIILQPILAVSGMYLFMRILGLRTVSSVFAAVAYGFCLYMTVFLEYNTIGHILGLLPFALYGLEKYLRTQRPWAILVFIFSLSVMFLAGHLQLATLAFGFTVIYCIFRLYIEKSSKKLIAVYAGSLAISLLVASIQLIPALELIQNSARVSQEYEFLVNKLLFQPYQLAMFFVPDIFGNPATRNFLANETYPTKAGYIGILPLMFAVVAAFSLKKNKIIMFFSGVCLLALLFLVRSPFTELFYSFEIPLFSSSSPSNAWFLFSLSACALAGFGMEKVLQNKIKPREIITFSLFALVILSLSFLLKKESVYLKQVVLPFFILLIGIVLVFLASRTKSKKYLICLGLIVLTTLELFYLFQKFNPFSPKDSFYPPSEVVNFIKENSKGSRTIGIGQAAILPNLQTQLRIYSPEGYDPLYPKTYAQFVYSTEKQMLFSDFSNATRSNASLGDLFGDGKLVEDENKLKVINALNVRVVLDRVENGNTEKNFPSQTFKSVYDKDGWKVYENLSALPKAYLVGSFKVVDDEDFAKTFFSPDFDLKESVVLAKDPGITQENRTGGKVVANYLKENEVSFTGTSQSDAIFVLGDTYYPGWKAFIDGKETEIIRANHTFRAVVFPKGEHEVLFVYSPTSFIYGMYISIIGILLAVGTFVYLRKS